jgi:uncharacterized membrane protein YfcA
MANATMTVALWPGTLSSLFAQRKELLLHTKWLPVFIPLSLLGGAIGAYILISTSNEGFATLVPYLMLLAAALFTFKDALLNWMSRLPVGAKHRSNIYWPLLIFVQLLISVYGGFFGAGMGIMFLAFLAMIGIHNIHEANAVRNCSAACINSIATVIFILSDNVAWFYMLPMMAGAIIGGYVCAHYVKRVCPALVRKVVIIIAWLMTFYFFIKYMV